MLLWTTNAAKLEVEKWIELSEYRHPVMLRR
jgi:hypothetical protein